MTTRTLHVTPSLRQDRSFGSAREAIDHVAVRAQRLRGEESGLRGLVIELEYEDAKLAVTLSGNRRVTLFVQDGIVEWTVEAVEEQAAGSRRRVAGEAIRLVWHPLDSGDDPFEQVWDRPGLSEVLASSRMMGMSVKEATIGLQFEGGLVLLCTACRILGTPDYLLYWGDQG